VQHSIIYILTVDIYLYYFINTHMSLSRDTHLIFEKYVTLTERVTVENILKVLDNKNEKVAAKLIEMDKTPSKGHVVKLAKFFNEIQNLDVLDSYYTKFLNLKKRNRVQDISRFEKFTDMEHAIDALETKVKLDMPENVEDAEKPSYEDKYVKVFPAETQGKCVELGRNYSFCISRTSGSLYSSYRLRDQSNFYFVRIKNRTDEQDEHGRYKDPAHLIVVDALPDDKFQWTWADNGSQGHGTESVTKEEMVKEVPELKGAIEKNVFVPKPLSKEERSKIERFNELASEFSLESFNKLKYSEKEEFLQQGNVKLHFQAWKTLDKNLRNEYLKVLTEFNKDILNDLKTPGEKKMFDDRMRKNPDAGFDYFVYLDGLEVPDER